MPRNTAEKRSQSKDVTVSTVSKPVYGNFQRYYHIRNPTSSTHTAPTEDNDTTAVHPALALDTRVVAILRFLKSHLSASKSASKSSGGRELFSVLDVGCNSGKLTIQLAQTLPALLRKADRIDAVEVIGVDIDPVLIKQANEAAAVARSLYEPALAISQGASDGGDGREEQLPTEAVFFPSVFPALFGAIPTTAQDESILPSSKRQRLSTNTTSTTPSHLSPPALQFLAAEWINATQSSTIPFHYSPSSLATLQTLDTRRYNLITALSVTKWIHIQQSDLGLCRFFARLCHTLVPNALLFLERQEWRSYSTAKNLDPSMRNKIKRLQMRPGGDFDYLLEAMGLRFVGKVGKGKGEGFERPLQVFRKIIKGEEVEKGEKLVKSVLEGEARFDWVSRPPNAVE